MQDLTPMLPLHRTVISGIIELSLSVLERCNSVSFFLCPVILKLVEHLNFSRCHCKSLPKVILFLLYFSFLRYGIQFLHSENVHFSIRRAIIKYEPTFLRLVYRRLLFCIESLTKLLARSTVKMLPERHRVQTNQPLNLFEKLPYHCTVCTADFKNSKARGWWPHYIKTLVLSFA